MGVSAVETGDIGWEELEVPGMVIFCVDLRYG